MLGGKNRELRIENRNWNHLFSNFRFVEIICLLLVSLSILLPSLIGGAAPPPREKQLVYGLSAFNGGNGYGGSFCPKSEGTIYLVANSDNALSPRMTEVYYWAITRRYMADWNALNEEVKGEMEILQDGKVIKTLEKMSYTLYQPEGIFSDVGTLYSEEEAEKLFEQYEKDIDDYIDRRMQFLDDKSKYEEEISKLLQMLSEMREEAEARGEEPPVIPREEIPEAPVEPKPPSYYVTKPSGAYIVNLAEGEYEIRIKDEKGKIVEGSQKKLIVFKERRSGVGYKLMEETNWTKPDYYDDPSDTLYVSGRKTIYFLQPFDEREYNEFQHRKAMESQDRSGWEGNWIWVHSDPKKDVTIEFFQNGKLIEKIEEKEFYVEQSYISPIGYNIIEYDEEEMPYVEPSFSAHRLVLEAQRGATEYSIRLLDADGKEIKLASRKIRVVKGGRENILYLLALSPLVLGAVVFIWRRSAILSLKNR